MTSPSLLPRPSFFFNCSPPASAEELLPLSELHPVSPSRIARPQLPRVGAGGRRRIKRRPHSWELELEEQLATTGKAQHPTGETRERGKQRQGSVLRSSTASYLPSCPPDVLGARRTMESSVRRVRCPRCHSVLEEPSAPVYQCGGCGTSLRAKNRTGTGSGAGDAARALPSRSGLPPQTKHLHASDVASTSRSSTPTPPHVGSTSRSGTPTPPDVGGSSRSGTSTPPHVGTSWHRVTDATGSRHGSGDLALVSAGTRGSGDVASTSSTPDATASSRRQGTDATSRRESGGLVSGATSHASVDVGSTSSTPDATAGSRRHGADTTSRGESDDPAPARTRVSEQVSLIEKRGREQSAAGQEVRDAGGAESGADSHGVGGARLSLGKRDTTSESQDETEKGMKRQAESTDAARKKHSGEAAVKPQYHHDHRQELVPKSSAQPAAAQPAQEEDAAAAAAATGEKATSPSRHELQEEHLGPLRKKILKTVDELKGDLSELFKSPELNPPRARPPRLPKQEGYVSRAAAAAGLPARARHAAAATDGHRGHHGSAAPGLKPRQAAAPLRGLPSRRYRQCRAHPCCHNVKPRSCHHGHGCCRHHGKPECSSCRGYCCRPRAQEPSAPRKPPAAKEPKRRLPPRNHCRPVLKGAPFIVCSSCFKLVQVPADFAVATRTVRKLRCGSCSTVLSYSYRDPARKKAYQDSDRCSTDGSELHGGISYERPDPFAFIDGFGLSSYSTEDEQRLPVSRNTSFDTLDGTKGVGVLHRLMGYGSASELLRHSPDLYESFSDRTTPDVRHHDTKGKGVCIDDDYDVDDSDEEDIRALKRSAGKGSGWPLPWMPGKGTPAAGAIRIK